MNAKKLLALSLACTLTLGLSACGGGQDAPSSSSPSGASDGDALKVGIILSTGGLGDKNFNDMTYAGAQQAEKDFGIEFDYVETQSASDFLPNYRMFAESGEYDLIIGLAADQTEAINEISIDFPEQKISHIDSSTDLPNVSAVYTKWQEQTFLTGVVAGLGTLSGMDKANSENVVGVILGQDQPTLRMGVVGFEAGVRYVNPDCEVLEAVVGDFNDPANPVVERVDYDFSQSGHALCIVDTASSHGDLTDDYAAVTREMGAVAAHFGKSVLRDVPLEDFHAAVPALRQECGDRAVLRAMHFYDDDHRALLEAAALKNGDFDFFLSLVNQSGLSSALHLQNTWSVHDTRQQAIPLALAEAERLLDGGACRVHGGGFAGTIQAWVPEEYLTVFKNGIEGLFGPGKCHVLHIRPQGGCVVAE